MKFVVDGYEIEIKAKRAWETRCSKDAALGFMNSVAIWMGNSAKYDDFEDKNYDGYYTDKPEAIEISKRCAEYLRASKRDLHDQLAAYGCYDNLG